MEEAYAGNTGFSKYEALNTLVKVGRSGPIQRLRRS